MAHEYDIDDYESDDRPSLATMILKIGSDNRSKYFKNISEYLNIVYDNWGYQNHNTIIFIFDLDQSEYPRRAPSYDYYWNYHTTSGHEYSDEYKDLVHKVYCMRVVGGGGLHHDEMVAHFNTIIEKYGNDAYVDAINILGFEEDCWL